MTITTTTELINQYQELVILHNLYGSRCDFIPERSNIGYKFDRILELVINNYKHTASKKDILEHWYNAELVTDKLTPLSFEYLRKEPPELLGIVIIRMILGYHKLRIFCPLLNHWTPFCKWMEAGGGIPRYDEQEKYRLSRKNEVDNPEFHVTLHELLRRLKDDAG